MRLFLVRHGQAQASAEERYVGAIDPALDEAGLEQAHALIARLPAEATALVSSPQKRAMQTAAVLAPALAVPILVAQEFRERKLGVFEDLSQQEAKTQFPAQWEKKITRQWSAAPDGGETIEQVFERVTIGLEKLFLEFEGNTVVLVTHGFVAKVVRALLTPLTEEEFFEWQLANGSVVQFEVDTIPLQQRTFPVAAETQSTAAEP